MEKIFVQVASYRDACLLSTITIALKRAKYPDRITFGVCLQDSKETYGLVRRKTPERCRIAHVPYRKTQGIGWARQIAQNLYNGEEYELQIDSHMRFVKDWDEKLIGMWNQLPTKKSIISHYCPDWWAVPPEVMKKQVPNTMCICYFNDEELPDMMGLCSSYINSCEPTPVIHPVVSCHLLFTTPNFFEEVPIDPEMGFGYEEGAISLRAWTNGWDIYAPNSIIARHTWEKAMRWSTIWEDLPKEYDVTKDVSCKRWKRLCGMNPNPIKSNMGLGNIRTVKQYEKFAGVDFKARTITDEASWGKVCLDY